MIVSLMKKMVMLIGAWLLILIPPSSPFITDAQSMPDPRFGITEAFWQPKEAADLNVGWERILFYWREIQPTGPDDWNTLHVLEEWLHEADANGRTVVGLLKNTTPWASEDGTEAGLPKGLYLPDDDPGNLWANFVRRIAEYYGPLNVHHWIIWNEPEIGPGVYGYEFAGDVADYYQLLKVAYRVMKESDPEAVIHLAGLTWWHDQTYLNRLLSAIMADPQAPENDYFFDVISLHIYFRPETVRTVLNSVKAIQLQYNLNKPIWINETNAPPNRDPLWPTNRPNFEVDLEQQAWFIVQSLALGFASGAERISVYKLIDIHLPPGGESFGLMRPDFSYRPAYTAYELAIRHLQDFTDVQLEIAPESYVATFVRPYGRTHIAWARTSNSTTVNIPSVFSTTGTALDVSGRRQEIAAEEGAFSVQLEGARCYGECFIGGPPIFILERPSSVSVGRSESIPEYAGGIRPLSELQTAVSGTPIASNLVVGIPTRTAVNPSTMATVTTGLNDASQTNNPKVDQYANGKDNDPNVEAPAKNDLTSGSELGSNIGNYSRFSDSAGLLFIALGVCIAAGLVVFVWRTGKE